jgi:translation elongation factor EF-G
MPAAPGPLVEIAIEPRYATALPALLEAASQLAPDYPGFSAVTDAESGQTILRGASEAQLESICDRLEETAFFNRGAPQVAFRETITTRIVKDYTHKKQTGGSAQSPRAADAGPWSMTAMPASPHPWTRSRRRPRPWRCGRKTGDSRKQAPKRHDPGQKPARPELSLRGISN